MVFPPPEMIYKIASYLRSNNDIHAISKAFPTLRFKLQHIVKYEDYITFLKDKFTVEKILYKGNNLIAFPNKLKLLQFYRDFNQPITIPLPEKLQQLYFGTNFNQTVDGLLPSTVKKLVFFGKFNHPVDNLPPNLYELNFGKYFNHPINYLPKTLKILWLKEHFNHPIDELPDSIETLHLMSNYKQKINRLPANIKKLRTWSRFDREYSGEREYDYLKPLYPKMTIKYYINRGFGRY